MQGLSRERLVEASLTLVHEEGLDALSMRALADRLDVKAASLYWHVRDRRELLELVAESLLASVRQPRRAGGWRASFVGLSAALAEKVAEQNDALRILLEVPEVVQQSGVFRGMREQLESAGLPSADARDAALMAMTYVIAGRAPTPAGNGARHGEAAELAIDSGSRGVTIRAGSADMETLFRVPPGRPSAAPAVVRGEKVIVRRLRGVGRGELELNPRRPWRFQVQGPTWKTVLDAGGLDLQRLHVDSGAAKLEVFLPEPSGVVPVEISGGVVEVKLHRPEGSAAAVQLSSGVVQVKLDDFSTRATVFDTRWETPGGSAAPDRFEVRVNSGAVRVELDSYRLKAGAARAAVATAKAAPAVGALAILLDGVEARVAALGTSD